MLFTKSGEIGSDKSCKRRTHELSLRCAEFEVLTSYPSRDLGLDIHYPLVSFYLQIYYFFASHHVSWCSMTSYPSKAEIVLLIACVSVWSVCFSAECVCVCMCLYVETETETERIHIDLLQSWFSLRFSFMKLSYKHNTRICTTQFLVLNIPLKILFNEFMLKTSLSDLHLPS